MNSSPPEPKEAKLVDPDLVEQAVVGHGVPSQDPADAAQFALEPGEAERESKSALMGGGAVAGMAAGAVVGADDVDAVVNSPDIVDNSDIVD